MKTLDFAEMETLVSSVQNTNPPKDREEIARAFEAKSATAFKQPE